MTPEAQTIVLDREPTPAPADPGTGLALVIERLALNPEVDVAKLEKIIELQERILRHQAKADFARAFSKMQGEIPVITERGEIEVDGRIRSRYATNEDIQSTVKPILQRHGFSLRFRHEYDGPKMKIIGILAHDAGHCEQDEFLTAPDNGGKMNDIQRIGSARSYGQRYCTLALLNIATRGADDDGRAAGGSQAPDPPAGYSEWFLDMTSTADNGWPALSEAWKKSKKEFREYSGAHDTANWKELRAKATKVQG